MKHKKIVNKLLLRKLRKTKKSNIMWYRNFSAEFSLNFYDAMKASNVIYLLLKKTFFIIKSFENVA